MGFVIKIKLENNFQKYMKYKYIIWNNHMDINISIPWKS